MDSSTVEIIVSVVAGLLLVVGVLGTIFPILPGSMLIIGTLLVWAWVLGSSASWTAGLIGMALAAIGMSSSLVLTGRKMKKEQIPNGPVTIGVIVGIVGMFLIPGIGLFIVGMCRADVFELFRSAVLRVHDLYRGGTGGGGDGPDVGAHKVQSYRRPRASPP